MAFDKNFRIRRPRRPEFPTWTNDPVADAERYAAYLEEDAEFEEYDCESGEGEER